MASSGRLLESITHKLYAAAALFGSGVQRAAKYGLSLSQAVLFRQQQSEVVERRAVGGFGF